MDVSITEVRKHRIKKMREMCIGEIGKLVNAGFDHGQEVILRCYTGWVSLHNPANVWSDNVGSKAPPTLEVYIMKQSGPLPLEYVWES